jgi:hypothetical protein
MVISPYYLLRSISAVLLCLVLCQCETKRTVKSTRSSISFDQKSWGGQGGGTDSQEIRSKFAERGYKITEDGTIKADKPDLYQGKKPRGLDGEFGTKTARFEKMNAETKQFKTPEYLKRQEYAGVKTASESGSSAREGNSSQSRDRQAGKLFSKDSKSSTELDNFKTGSSAYSNREFATSADRSAPSVPEAPRAIGTPRTAGYQDNVTMSMDDVKKMLNPNSYARGTGISD